MLKGWYKKIDLFLSQKCFAAVIAKQHSSRTPIVFHSPLPAQSSPAIDPNAMDIDYRKPKKLTPKEREICFKEG